MVGRERVLTSRSLRRCLRLGVVRLERGELLQPSERVLRALLLLGAAAPEGHAHLVQPVAVRALVQPADLGRRP